MSLTEEEKQWIRDHPVVRARIGAAPPLHFFDGSPRGISVDYLNLIAQRAGFQVEYRTGIPWPEAMDAIKEHEKIDLILTAKITEERREFISFTENYLIIPLVIFTRDDVGFISSMEDLKHKKVSVERGYVLDHQLADRFPEIERLVVASTKEAIEAVASGRADGYIGNLTIATYIIRQNNLNNIKIAAPAPFENHNQAMAVRNDWPQLARIIDKTFKSLSPQEHESIKNRWMKVRFEYGITKSDFIKWVSVFCGFSAIILGIIIFWNRRLKKEVVQREKSEKALLENEAFIKLIMDNLPVGIAVNSIDPAVDFSYMNDNFPRFYRTKREDLADPDTFWESVYEDPVFREEIKRKVLRDCAGNDPEKMYWQDVPITRKGCETFYISARNVPIPEKQLMISTVWDVTERRRLEEQLQQAQKMEAIGTLAGGIAHDFNNILFPLIGFAEMLREDLPGDSTHQQSIREILQAALRARELVKQILSFSRQGVQTLQPVRLQSLLKEAVKLLGSSIPKTIDIQLDVDPDCGLVVADPTQVHQVVMNLAANAFHAMQESGGKLNISLAQTEIEPSSTDFFGLKPGVYALLKVIDTGEGIEKKILDRVFDPYFTTKPKDKGTGLGLSIVKGIVQRCHGDIYIFSEPGRGTEIRVYLPVMGKEKASEEPELFRPVQGGAERILLVDDEASIVKMEGQMLRRLGYRVTLETGSRQALETFRANPDAFDLVISDMTMPDMTGIQLANQMKGIRPDLPFIICTGFSDKIDENSSKAFGIQGYLVKPVVKNEFAQKIREVLNG